MCRRKRSRPSSKRRLTKNVKRLSSARSVCASAIGVVDEHRLRTNGPMLAMGAAGSTAPTAASVAKLGVAVITSPKTETFDFSGPEGCAWIRATAMGVRTYALMRVRGSPAVIGTRPLDRWLCVPVFRRVCPYHCTQSVKASRFGVKCRNVFSLSSERMRTQRAKASPSYVSTRRQRCVHEASGIYQMTCVVAARQIRRGNRHTPVRCVHEAAATEVDTDVIDAMRAQAEEHEVPGL